MLFYTKDVTDDAFERIPWQSWTPTVTYSSGTIGSYTVNKALYSIVGKIVFWHVDIKITDIGTGSGNVNITLPSGISVVNRGFGSGREADVTGDLLQAMAVGSSLIVHRYNNAPPGPDNLRIIADGFFEIS